MPLGTRTFRIFVSSTFTDLKEERNALQERVFPRLKDYCKRRGTRFQAIDLRWGVSEEAGFDQQAINICLDEIDRCRKTSPRPNFIVLLGDRYGWEPPPAQIPSYEFEEILRRFSPEEESLLKEWYLIDENAVPVDWYLRPREDEFKDGDVWFPIEQKLRAILEKAVADMALEAADRVKYETSATHQEIDRGALREKEDHVFCFFRSIEGLPSDASAKGFIDLDAGNHRDDQAAKRLENLKERLRALVPDNLHDYSASWVGADPPDSEQSPITLGHIDQLCDDVYNSLFGIIKHEIDTMEAVDRIDLEVKAHVDFANDRAQHFTGRVDILDRIRAYIDNPDGKPLVMFGASGSGKSAVMARAAQLAGEQEPDAVVMRFIGATPDSANARSLLDSLAHEISRRYGGDESTIPSDYRELVRDLPERLALAAEDRPLILFLDALDQLSTAEGGRSLSWLPTDLPPGVRVVVSTLRGDTLEPLRARLPDASLVELQAMKAAEGADLLEHWLEDAGRILQEPQRREVLAKFQAERLPLWLKLAFEEARRWKSSADFPLIDLPPSVSEIIRKKLFDRLDDDENHGKVMVSRSLSYLGAAKHGLTEDEMLDVLSLGGRDGPVLRDFRRRSPESPIVDTLPVVVWSRLYLDLEPYLTERTADEASLMTFYHRQLGEAVREEYLADQNGLDRHRELALYFGWQRLELGDAEPPKPNLRQMSELPYQQTKGQLWDDVFRTLTDFYFLEKKATYAGVIETTDAQGNEVKTYTGIYQIRDDYALALKEMPGGNGDGGDDSRRRIIVTGVDFGKGDGYVLRCPHCNTVHKFQDDWQEDEKFICPNDDCRGPLKVNNFVVPPRR